ncbi:MAG: tRNA (N(6)-L-threonylcarbamoyladenosine(37)-C(2))-methylthiotransferase MtaB [Candidatus Brocadiales bacterium]
MSKTCAFITLGCKANQYDTQVLREAFLGRKGYREVPSGSPADLYVVNTCAVTSTSEAKSRQEIRKAVRLDPGAEVIVTGCYAKADPGVLRGIEGVDEVVDREILTRSLLEETGDDSSANPGISRFEGHGRAFLKIEDGCDAHCSYCIIPMVRGRTIKSKPPEDVAAEAKRVAGNGYKEVVLTGIHLGAYGRDLNGVTITDVLRQLKGVDGIYRIRLSSLEASEVTDELIDLMADGDSKLCPHLHLSLQSGDDDILKMMNRRYTAGQYLDVIERVRSRLPNVSFSTDVMVGFPGEGVGQFENTLDVCRRVGFSRMHIFPFSPRKGTPAAGMNGRSVPAETIRSRRAALRDLADQLALDYKTRFLGEKIDILVEEKRSDGMLSGYSERYIKALFPGPSGLIGSIVPVEVEEVFPGYVRGVWRGGL